MGIRANLQHIQNFRQHDNMSDGTSNESGVAVVPRNAAQGAAQVSFEHEAPEVPVSQYLNHRYLERGIEEAEREKLQILIRSEEGFNDFDRKACAGCGLLYIIGDTATSLACGHLYCDKCLSKMLYLVLKKVNGFPARCCGVPVRKRQIEVAVSNYDLERQYLRLMRDIISAPRLYCSAKTCSAPISSTDIVDQVGTCSRQDCHVKTCAKCKQDMAVHNDNSSCPPNEEHDSLVALATKERWQKCTGCGNMVERSDGCNHITCHLCGYEFCYVCGGNYDDCLVYCPGYRDPFREQQNAQNERLLEERVEESDDRREFDNGVDTANTMQEGEEYALHVNEGPTWPPAVLNADRLRPLTVEEADPRNYLTNFDKDPENFPKDAWYDVAPFDCHTKRRRTPSQVLNLQMERLDDEIDGPQWVHLDAAEVLRHQELDRTGAPCLHRDDQPGYDRSCEDCGYIFLGCFLCATPTCQYCRLGALEDEVVESWYEADFM